MSDAPAGFSFSAAPPPEASAYFRDKSLRPAFRWSEVWGEEHAYAFTVAKAVQLEVLGAIKDSLQRAINEGRPYRAWAADLKPELQRMGWWGRKEMADPATGELREVQLGSPRRLQTIYDANLRSARAAGQWERAQRTKAVLPFFVYELGPSMRHRPEHAAREGMIAAVDDPVWDSWYPPNGWGCKCHLRQITRTQAEAAGGPSDLGSGELATRAFARRRDDGSVERVRVPKGIDPGWAGNPGRNRAATLMRALEEKLAAGGPEVAKASIGSLWRSSTASVLPKLEGRYFAPAAVVPPRVRDAIGAEASVAMVSAETLRTKLTDPNKHGGRPVMADSFGRVQAILDLGEPVQPEGAAQAYVLEMDDGWWKVAVKRAAGGREIIVTTLFPIEARKAASLKRKAGGGSALPRRP